MYSTLLILHSITRWLVLLSLLTAIFRAWRGYARKLPFTKTDNSVRHGTATIAHVQLIIGFSLYLISPLIKAFFASPKQNIGQLNLAFFGVVHFLVMLTAIVVITIGSALAKRRTTDTNKFRTMLIWFSAGLLLIFLAIPWPFSPFANRPYIRLF